MSLRDEDSPRKRSAPRRMSEVLPQLIAQRGYARLLSHNEFADAWQQASGSLSQLSRAGNLRGGVLEIVVKNSVVLQELMFQKRTLIKTIQALVPHQTIRDLKFTVGAWEETNL